MVAFVGPSAAPLASTSSRFVSGTTALTDEPRRAARPSARRAPTMKVLDGLDTVVQDSYSFSRYVLGPFQPNVLSPNSSDGDREVAIRAAYRHVFGNAYVMEEERAELAIAESQFKRGAITAKDFVRALAKSSAYKTRFFEGASQYRFIELNFMHLLGRAPDTRAEMTEHLQRYVTHGVDADIDSYIDSAEYDSVFGDDNIPFLRFRGAYTPCDSFNKQCALKGGWANSDKAMGGAALSGFNGSDGRQSCDRISAYITDDTTPYEQVAENTPLKSTAPNWYACPNPAVPPTPAYVSAAEVRALSARVSALQAQYNAEIAKKNATSKDALAPFRSMVTDMGPMLDRGVAISDPALANPFAKLASESSALADGGCKSSDYKRFHQQMENDTVSRLERDLEEARANLRVLAKALANSTPVTPTIELPGTVLEGITVSAEDTGKVRPRVKVGPRAAKPVVSKKAEPKSKVKLGPIEFSLPELPKVPELPKLPELPNPFAKKE